MRHTIRFILCYHLLLDLPFICPVIIPLEKINFSLASECQLVARVHLPLSVLGRHLVRTHTGLMSCHSLCESILHQFSCIWKTLFPWTNLPPPLTLTISLPPLLHSLLSPEGRGLMKTKSLNSLHIVLFWVSVLVPIYCRRMIVWRWMSKALIYGYSTKLLGCFFIVLFL